MSEVYIHTVKIDKIYISFLLILVAYNQLLFCENKPLKHEYYMLADLIPSTHQATSENYGQEFSLTKKMEIIEYSPTYLTSEVEDVYFKWPDLIDVAKLISTMDEGGTPGVVISGKFWGWMPILVILDECMGTNCFWGLDGIFIAALAQASELLLCGTIGGRFRGTFYLNLVYKSVYISDIDIFVNGIIFHDDTKLSNFLENTSQAELETLDRQRIAADELARIILEKGVR